MHPDRPLSNIDPKTLARNAYHLPPEQLNAHNRDAPTFRPRSIIALNVMLQLFKPISPCVSNVRAGCSGECHRKLIVQNFQGRRSCLWLRSLNQIKVRVGVPPIAGRSSRHLERLKGLESSTFFLEDMSKLNKPGPGMSSTSKTSSESLDRTPLCSRSGRPALFTSSHSSKPNKTFSGRGESRCTVPEGVCRSPAGCTLALVRVWERRSSRPYERRQRPHSPD